MSGNYRPIRASRLLLAALPIALVGASASATNKGSEGQTDPMRFFEGRTESVSTIKLIYAQAKSPLRVFAEAFKFRKDGG